MNSLRLRAFYLGCRFVWWICPEPQRSRLQAGIPRWSDMEKKS